MDITSYINPLILLACLVVGYCIKHIKATAKLSDFIPLVMAVLGAVLICFTGEPTTLQLIVSGALTGLASTGLHQAFVRTIDGLSDKQGDD